MKVVPARERKAREQERGGMRVTACVFGDREKKIGLPLGKSGDGKKRNVVLDFPPF